jgi:hypothetical protein
MKVKKEQCHIRLKKPIGQLLAVNWFTDPHIMYRMSQVSLENMPRGDRSGRPIYFAIADQILYFYPSADQRGEIKITYFPPPEEM